MGEDGVMWSYNKKNAESLIFGAALPSPLRTNVLANPTGGGDVLKRRLNSRLSRRLRRDPEETAG